MATTQNALTDVAETQVGTWLLTTGTVTRPTAWYAALFTSAPGETGGGTECADATYTREAVAFSETATAGEFDNDAAVTFGPFTAAVEIVAVAIFDASTSGRMLAYGTQTSSVGAGGSFEYPAGALKIQVK